MSSLASSCKAFFIEGQKEVGMVVVIKELMAFHWLSCDPLLWLKFCQEKEGNLLFSPVGLCYHCRTWELLPSCFSVLDNWGFCLLVFHTIAPLSLLPRKSEHHGYIVRATMDTLGSDLGTEVTGTPLQQIQWCNTGTQP